MHNDYNSLLGTKQINNKQRETLKFLLYHLYRIVDKAIVFRQGRR